jgi:hypothetical protein
MTTPKPPHNTSAVKDPKWTGEESDSAFVIVVSRGEPRRSNGQMQQGVYGQVRRYLELTKVEVSEVGAALAVQLIANDYIDPVGSQGVMLTRKSLRLYVEKAQGVLGELEEHDG